MSPSRVPRPAPAHVATAAQVTGSRQQFATPHRTHPPERERAETVPPRAPTARHNRLHATTTDTHTASVLRALLHPEHAHPVASPRPLPAHITQPLRWCMATTALDARQRATEMAVLRSDNPRALVGELDDRLLLLSVEPPVCDRLTVPCATAVIEEGGSIDTAADLACQAAAFARLYGHTPLDARDVLPLVRLLKQGTERDEDFLCRSLGPLRGDPRHAHLLTTLRAYLRHGMSTAATARSLYLHRHTLDNRLRRIRQLTGLDLTHPLHRLRAEIALLLTIPNRPLSAGAEHGASHRVGAGGGAAVSCFQPVGLEARFG